MQFGKYKGKTFAEVPDSYLIWLYDNGLNEGDLKTYIEDSVPAIANSINKKNERVNRDDIP